MERGNSTHSPRQDDALEEELSGNLGPGGSNREEWADPEPPADDDPDIDIDIDIDIDPTIAATEDREPARDAGEPGPAA